MKLLREDQSISTQPVTGDFTTDPRWKWVLISLILNVFTYAVDQTITSTAIPSIVSHFDGLQQIAWVNTAFFTASAGSILVFTDLMTIVSPKTVYIAATVVFELGCAISGAATSMNMLIVGRAISGLGGAGCFSGTYILISQLVPIQKRPGKNAMVASAYVIANVLGPLIGGALVSGIKEAGWRWCFYINPPIGFVCLLGLCLSLPVSVPILPRDGQADARSIRRVASLDWISVMLCSGSVVTFLTGFQRAGVDYAWTDVPTIVMIALSPMLLVLLTVWSVYKGESAMIPLRLLKCRHTSACMVVTLTAYGMIVVYSYFMSVYLQAVQGYSAIKTGILFISYQLVFTMLLIISGKGAERTGIIWPWVPTGFVIAIVGTALWNTFGVNTGLGSIIGFQAVAGFGIGMIMNIVLVSLQIKLEENPVEVPYGIGLFNFFGFIGRVMGLGTATAIFSNKLRLEIDPIGGLPDNLKQLVRVSIAAIRESVPAEFQEVILESYSNSIKLVWIWSVVMGAVGLCAALCMRNFRLDHSVVKESQESKSTEYSSESTPNVTPNSSSYSSPDLKESYQKEEYEINNETDIVRYARADSGYFGDVEKGKTTY